MSLKTVVSDSVPCIRASSFFPPASGLYYVAELIEEYSVLAKRVITYMLVVRGEVFFPAMTHYH